MKGSGGGGGESQSRGFVWLGGRGFPMLKGCLVVPAGILLTMVMVL
jgi:hypothetical protein